MKFGGAILRLIIKPDYGFLEKDLELYNIPLDATIEYEVTLKECERAGEAHEQDTKQNLAQAKATKDRATIYYIQNKYELAARVFDKANTFLQNCTSKAFVFVQFAEQSLVRSYC